MSKTLRAWKLGRLYVKLEFKSQDCWIGAYWSRQLAPIGGGYAVRRDVWVCPLPMLPFHFTWFCGGSHA